MTEGIDSALLNKSVIIYIMEINMQYLGIGALDYYAVD